MAANPTVATPHLGTVIEPLRHKRSRLAKEKVIELLLFSAALVAVFTTIAIVSILLIESAGFFQHVRSDRFSDRHGLDASVRRPSLWNPSTRVGNIDRRGRRAAW